MKCRGKETTEKTYIRHPWREHSAMHKILSHFHEVDKWKNIAQECILLSKMTVGYQSRQCERHGISAGNLFQLSTTIQCLVVFRDTQLSETES